MGAAAAAGAVILLFALAFRGLRIVEASLKTIDIGRIGMGEQMDRRVDDDAKEAAARVTAGRLGLRFLVLLGLMATAVTGPILLATALHLRGLVSFEELSRTLMSWPAILAAIAATVALIRR